MSRSSSFQAVILTTVAFGALCAGGGTRSGAVQADQPRLGRSRSRDPHRPEPGQYLGRFQSSREPVLDLEPGHGHIEPLHGNRQHRRRAGQFLSLSRDQLRAVRHVATVAQDRPARSQIRPGRPLNPSRQPGRPPLFIFANLNGTISAWNGSTSMPRQERRDGRRSAIAGAPLSPDWRSTGSGSLLYAANGAVPAPSMSSTGHSPRHVTHGGMFRTPTFPPDSSPSMSRTSAARFM